MKAVTITEITAPELEILFENSIKKVLSIHQTEQTPTEQTEQLLTVQEAAKLLHLTVPTIYSKHSKNELPGVCKRGKRLYFSKLSLIDWVKEGRKKSNVEVEAEGNAYLSNHKKALQNGK